MIKFIKELAETLFPSYFAFIMATGALSISAFLLGMRVLADAFLYLNIAAFIILWILTLIRLVRNSKQIFADLTSHTIGSGFFTTVAGTCVLGSQLIIVAQSYTAALYLWGLGIFLWVIVMYTFFTAVTVAKNTPTLEEGINGAWLIAAVATQSISILGTLLVPYLSSGRDVVLFFTVCMYFLGCMLYLNIITLIFYRFTFLKLDFTAMTPPYWINMGAVAITSLAGATLILNATYWSFLVEIRPFLKGFTLFFWAAGTWWIPLLFILVFWRHVYHRYPLDYGPQWWAMVFPLAMYTTSTWKLAVALDVPFLKAIPRVMFYVALLTWLAVFGGLLHHVYIRTITFYRAQRIETRRL
ncbi:tellurite resistance/C4-dicarboxylate transporter family protein [Planococcus versutus]|uniref:C4-dicarboxylate ABC transporter n=1 Tax=Planococcus versutus TaxID=1302659 RepID=A0A1B1RZ09_9BACL|nr:tellurite resistance/C4-dicarboxylate transporter family protein [Planococcus versutus]ANU26171.1 C4-dicarboxylate ABC transporter [Planococcus versutus]